MVLVGLFGFYKVNGRHFHLFLLTLLQTFKKPSLRVWHRINLEEMKIISESPKSLPQRVPLKIVPKSRISRLALIADTGGEYKGEE
jgi:hypothetical protein